MGELLSCLFYKGVRNCSTGFLIYVLEALSNLYDLNEDIPHYIASELVKELNIRGIE